MAFRILWKYGTCSSGIMPENFETQEAAQEQCDLENKEYNNVNHYVDEV